MVADEARIGKLVVWVAVAFFLLVITAGVVVRLWIWPSYPMTPAPWKKVCWANQRLMENAALEYLAANDELPTDLEELVGVDGLLPAMPVCGEDGTYTYSVEGSGTPVVTCDVHGHRPPLEQD